MCFRVVVFKPDRDCKSECINGQCRRHTKVRGVKIQTLRQAHTKTNKYTRIYREGGGNGVKLMSGKDSHLLL